jgi:hypothetical protein
VVFIVRVGAWLLLCAALRAAQEIKAGSEDVHGPGRR